MDQAMAYYNIPIDITHMGKDIFIQLLEYSILAKQRQQLYDKYLLSLIKNPLYCKWIQEIIVDQYKHEKILKEIYVHYKEKDFISESIEYKPDNKNISVQIEQRIEAVFENILLFNKMSSYTVVNTAKQILCEIVLDEQIHGYKLGLIYKG